MKKFPTTIVIADDDEDDIALLESSIKTLNANIKITNVRNGLKLLMLVNKEKPDAVFLDINMPVKNGIECLKELRDNKSLSDTRVIIYSTSNNLDEINECYRLGANFYFIKPNEVSSLNSSLDRLLKNDHFIKNNKPTREDFVLDEA